MSATARRPGRDFWAWVPFLRLLWQDPWQYGVAGDPPRRARRHRKQGSVQFVLWQAGQQGHSEDYWYDMDSSWWPTFVADEQ